MTGSSDEPATVVCDVLLDHITDGVVTFDPVNRADQPTNTESRPWCDESMISPNATPGSVYEAEINTETNEIVLLSYRAKQSIRQKRLQKNTQSSDGDPALLRNESENPILSPE